MHLAGITPHVAGRGTQGWPFRGRHPADRGGSRYRGGPPYRVGRRPASGAVPRAAT